MKSPRGYDGWRSTAFDDCEDRLALSAQPLGDLHLEGLLGDRISPHELVQPMLMEAHQQTGANYVRAAYGLAGGGQTVAIIDSGIAYDHFALGGGFGTGYKVVGGWDFTEENDADPYDDGPAGFHGTHVAGIVGSTDERRPGVAPDVDLVALRVFNDQGQGYFRWVESALQWVYDNRDAFRYPITTVNLSLGTEWNSDRPPASAILEDEFARLESVGIFISVSAGNSFSQYQTTGLSYPAASPYVVPVASVNDAGQMSGFSQRHDRVIAAPGERIVSTVPDHIFGSDGVPNDWGSASGTSMAAPYVAGASVLIRQAMELAGYATVDQAAIYAHMRTTADLVYDAATQASYHKLNLGRAIDVLLGVDDYGSTAATAHSLGVLSGETSIAGLIGRLDDRDFFRFTAGQTGVVTLDLASPQNMHTAWTLDGGGQASGSQFTFDVVAGREYTFSVASQSGVARYEIAATLTPSIVVHDWGAVAQARFAGEQVSGESWYRATATRQGLFTVEATGGGSWRLEVYDAAQQLVAGRNVAAGAARIDVAAAAGQQFLVRLVANTATVGVDFRLTNLVSVGAGQVDVYGTPGDDNFTFLAGARILAAVNGVEYNFSYAEAATVRFHGGAGHDSIAMFGSQGDDTAVVRVGHARLSGAGFQAVAVNVESVRIDGRGGYDTATLYDSAGDDAFVTRVGHARMFGAGYDHVVQGFERTIGRSENGGYDIARLHDSVGDDQFVARPDSVVMRGDNFIHHAIGFDHAMAIRTAGGNDIATFYDSAGDDVFLVRPDYARMIGPGFTNVASGFEQVRAHSTAGGFDVATLQDSPGNDQFIARPTSAVMRGANFQYNVFGFARVTGQSLNGGYDTAILHDSAGDDHLVARPFNVVLRGPGFENRATGFGVVTALATAGGNDFARFFDSVGDDTFVDRIASATMHGAGYQNSAHGFAQRHVTSTAGGIDRAVFHELGQLDALVVRNTGVVVDRAGGQTNLSGFANVQARGDAELTVNGELNALAYLFQLLGS